MSVSSRIISPKIVNCILILCLFSVFSQRQGWAQQVGLCLDGFCIGQSIQNVQFDKTVWITPRNITKERCDKVGCQPAIAFRGYTKEDQAKLADAVTWRYDAAINSYNVLTKDNLGALRLYKYECNPSARGVWGERRFLGAFRSVPSQYLTVVGLRLIGGELKVYRIARQYPFHNQNELTSLAKELHGQYEQRLSFYDYLSSNAYSNVIEQHKDGWFARSTMFNPSDLSDNAAELVLIDPNTRSLLQPTSMPESGEIKPLPVHLPPACSRSIPLQ